MQNKYLENKMTCRTMEARQARKQKQKAYDYALEIMVARILFTVMLMLGFTLLFIMIIGDGMPYIRDTEDHSIVLGCAVVIIAMAMGGILISFDSNFLK